MPVTHTRQGSTVIYKISGVFDTNAAYQYLQLSTADYNEIGDALGTVIDYQEMSKFTINGLRTIQEHAQDQFDTPVAFVGKPDSIGVTFLRGFEAISSRGKSRFSFFSSIAEAIKWIDDWYRIQNKDREALWGHVSTHYPPPE